MAYGSRDKSLDASSRIENQALNQLLECSVCINCVLAGPDQ